MYGNALAQATGSTRSGWMANSSAVAVAVLDAARDSHEALRSSRRMTRYTSALFTTCPNRLSAWNPIGDKPKIDVTADQVSQVIGWRCPMALVVKAHPRIPGDDSRWFSVIVYGSSQLTNWFAMSGTNAASVNAAIAIIQTKSTRVSLFFPADTSVGLLVAAVRLLGMR